MVSILSRLESEILGTLQNGLDAVPSGHTGLQQHAAGLVRSNSTVFFQVFLVIVNTRWRDGSSISVVSLALSFPENDKNRNADDYTCVCSCSVFNRELKHPHVKTIMSTRKVKGKLWDFVYWTASQSRSISPYGKWGVVVFRVKSETTALSDICSGAVSYVTEEVRL